MEEICDISYEEFKERLEKASLIAPYYHWNLNLSKESKDHLFFIIDNNSVEIRNSIRKNKRAEIFIFKNKGFMKDKMIQCFEEWKIGGGFFKLNNEFSKFLDVYEAERIQ